MQDLQEPEHSSVQHGFLVQKNSSRFQRAELVGKSSPTPQDHRYLEVCLPRFKFHVLILQPLTFKILWFLDQWLSRVVFVGPQVAYKTDDHSSGHNTVVACTRYIF